MQLGFSVYLGEDFDETYIEAMLNKGFRYIFTSLQIPEDDQTQYLERLRQLSILNQSRAKVIADVNGKTFGQLGLSLETPSSIKDAGIDIIRLDEAIDINQIADYVENGNPIMLNASTDAFPILRELNDRGISQENIYVAHNYYPRPNTGLDTAFFQHINERLKGAYPELQIMAFVPGTKLRGPIHRGLPTLEAHRYQHPLASAYDLELMLTDVVCIGDSGINNFMMRQFFHYATENTVWLRTNLDSDSPYLRRFTNRPDVARDVVRAQESRKEFNDEVEARNAVECPQGTITLDNNLYGRYMNELEITRRDLPADAAVNVLGHIEDADLDCIKLIQSGTPFKLFNEKGEEENEH